MPPNRRRSVSTLITRAPPAAYWTASSAGSGMSASSPLDGLRRLTSAMTPTPGARSAARASRAGRASRAAAFTSASGTQRLAGGEVLADAGHDLVEHAHGAASERVRALTRSSGSRTDVPSPAGSVDSL